LFEMSGEGMLGAELGLGKVDDGRSEVRMRCRLAYGVVLRSPLLGRPAAIAEGQHSATLGELERGARGHGRLRRSVLAADGGDRARVPEVDVDLGGDVHVVRARDAAQPQLLRTTPALLPPRERRDAFARFPIDRDRRLGTVAPQPERELLPVWDKG